MDLWVRNYILHVILDTIVNEVTIKMRIMRGEPKAILSLKLKP